MVGLAAGPDKYVTAGQGGERERGFGGCLWLWAMCVQQDLVMLTL